MGWYTDYYIYICTQTNYDPKVLLEKIKNPDQKIKDKLAGRKHEMDFDEWCGYGNMTCTCDFDIEEVYDENDIDKINILMDWSYSKYTITTNQKRGDKSSLKYLVALIDESLGPDVKCIYGIYSGEDGYAEMQLMDEVEPRTIWVDKR